MIFNKRIGFLLISIFFIFQIGIAQDNPPAGNSCEEAPLICNLNGYEGSTSDEYDINAWGNKGNIFSAGTGLIGEFDDCNGSSIENNSFLKFIAGDVSVTFTITVFNCEKYSFLSAPDYYGIQYMVFSLDDQCGQGNVTSYYCEPRLAPPYPDNSQTSSTFTVNGLTAGETYYIMIDGESGDQCDYIIQAENGIQETSAEVVISTSLTNNSVCAGEEFSLNVTGDGETFEWTGQGLTSSTGASVQVTAPQQAGTYEYEVTTTISAENECAANQTVSDIITITVEECEEEECTPPNLHIDNLDICAGNSINLNDAINSSSDQSNTSFYTSQEDANTASNAISNTVSESGTYWVRAEDSNDTDCFNVFQIQITETTITYTVNITNENCGETNGQIILSAEGGEGPYSYSIDNGTSSQNNGAFDNLSSGVFNVLITDANGCTVQETESVGNIGGPEINNITVTEPSCIDLCDGNAEVEVSGGSDPYTTTWTDGNGNTVNTDQFCAGDYIVEIMDANNCSTFGNVTISNPEGSTFDLSSIDPNCGQNDGTIIISGLSSNTDYDVSFSTGEGMYGPIGKTSDNAGEININDLSVGTYSNFILVDDGGCTMDNNTTLQLIDSDAPNVTAPADLNICLGESITLTASNPDNGTITWNNGVTNGVPFTPTSTGTHVYTVTATIGDCSTTDQVTVYVEASPEPEFIADITEGCDPLTVNFSNLTSGNSNECVWDFGDGNTSQVCDNTTHTYTSGGNYTVSLTVSTANGCSGTVTKINYITVTSKPIASFEANPMVATVFDPEVNFYNTSTNANSYEWNFGDGSPYSNDFNTSHTYSDDPSNYIVTLVVSNGDGCSDTVRTAIKVEDVIIFYIPNTFTPDGNSFNDYFSPVFTSGIDPYDFNMQIFNRWGELVFETNNMDIGWDGRNEKGIIKDGTYVWKLEFQETMSDKRHTHVGHISIIR